MENRIDFLKKMGHEKKMNVDFKGNICKYVMMNGKKLKTPTRVRVRLVV